MLNQRYLKADKDFLAQYSPRQLGLEGGWPGLSVPLHEFAKRPLSDCRVDFGALRQMIQKLGGNPGDRRLIFSTRIEKTRYWVWALPGQERSALINRIVFLRQPYGGDCELGFWDIYRQFTERATKDEISRRLLQIEFGVNTLMTVPARLVS